jgi:hypothetical protein
MAGHSVGTRRTSSPRGYLRATRVVGGLSVLVLFGAIAWDLVDDEFWSHHALFTGLVSSLTRRRSRPARRWYWWGSVLDESDPLEEHLGRPRLSRVSPATQAAVGPVEDEWLRDNLVAIAQLAESVDRGPFELAMRIVPLDWWVAQLPDRPSTAEHLRT